MAKLVLFIVMVLVPAAAMADPIPYLYLSPFVGPDERGEGPLPAGPGRFSVDIRLNVDFAPEPDDYYWSDMSMRIKPIFVDSANTPSTAFSLAPNQGGLLAFPIYPHVYYPESVFLSPSPVEVDYSDQSLGVSLSVLPEPFNPEGWPIVLPEGYQMTVQYDYSAAAIGQYTICQESDSAFARRFQGHVSVVPEPCSVLILGIGIGWMLRRRCRRLAGLIGIKR